MSLSYEVCVTKRPGVLANVPAGLDNLKWVPTSSVLIYGANDAVLVDVPLTVSMTKEVVDWVVASGKDVKYIYITHPHGDHYFGVGMILEVFPNAKPIATKEAVERMKLEIKREKTDAAFWNTRFKGEIPPNLVLPEALDGDLFELEGQKLEIVRTGHTDTDDTTTLFVPSIGLAVTGDAVYNNVYPYLNESGSKELRAEWRAALDKIAALKPKAVVCGHKDPSKDDSPSAIDETREYLETLERMNNEISSVEEFYSRALELFPGRINPGSLWGAVNTLQKEKN